MRALLGLAALLAAALPPAAGLGGLAVQGAGFGDYESNDGMVRCEGFPFAAQAVYLPEDRGVVHAEFVEGVPTTCPEAGMTFVCCRVDFDAAQTPPVGLTYYCTGSEAVGLSCSGIAGGVLITAEVGPYGGPGSTVTLSTTGLFRFDGTFLAA